MCKTEKKASTYSIGLEKFPEICIVRRLYQNCIGIGSNFEYISGYTYFEHVRWMSPRKMLILELFLKKSFVYHEMDYKVEPSYRTALASTSLFTDP